LKTVINILKKFIETQAIALKEMRFSFIAGRLANSFSNIRAAEGHYYYKTEGKMNALAILKRTFKNLQK